MEVFSLSANRLNRPKQFCLLALALGLWAFFVYVRWFATRAELLFISATEIDLLAHVAGGVFLAGVFEWWGRRPKLAILLVLVAGIAAGWELIELFFDPAMQFFYANAYDLWLLDSIGDVWGAFLGSYGYWVFLRNRRSTLIATQIHADHHTRNPR